MNVLYEYMDVKPGEYAKDVDLGYVFIGSCTLVTLDMLNSLKENISHRH